MEQDPLKKPAEQMSSFFLEVNRPGNAINAETKATEILSVGRYEMERITNPLIANVEDDRSYDWLVIKGTKIGNPIEILRELSKKGDVKLEEPSQ